MDNKNNNDDDFAPAITYYNNKRARYNEDEDEEAGAPLQVPVEPYRNASDDDYDNDEEEEHEEKVEIEEPGSMEIVHSVNFTRPSLMAAVASSLSSSSSSSSAAVQPIQRVLPVSAGPEEGVLTWEAGPMKPLKWDEIPDRFKGMCKACEFCEYSSDVKEAESNKNPSYESILHLAQENFIHVDTPTLMRQMQDLFEKDIREYNPDLSPMTLEMCYVHVTQHMISMPIQNAIVFKNIMMGMRSVEETELFEHARNVVTNQKTGQSRINEKALGKYTKLHAQIGKLGKELGIK